MNVLERCPEVMAYFEKDPPAMGRDIRIRKKAVIDKLVARSPAHVVAVKPIADSQWSDSLLQTYEEAKAFWIYRHYSDVANSNVRTFEGQMDRMKLFVEGRTTELGWRMERLEADDPDIQLASQCFSRATPEDYAAIMWVIRNRWYYKCGLHEHPRVRLLKYEQLVEHPKSVMQEFFDFLDVPFNEDYVRFIHPRSIGKNETPNFQPEVIAACESLLAKLDQSIEGQRIEP